MDSYGRGLHDRAVGSVGPAGRRLTLGDPERRRVGHAAGRGGVVERQGLELVDVTERPGDAQLPAGRKPNRP